MVVNGGKMRTKGEKEKVIRPVSSQLAEFLRLAPTPASSDEVGGSAVNFHTNRCFCTV
jgi:hypothetical protein